MEFRRDGKLLGFGNLPTGNGRFPKSGGGLHPLPDQIVGIAVTGEAIPITAVKGWGVGQAVAIPAPGGGRMRSAVAVTAAEYPVIGVGRSEGLGGFPMTGPALGGRNMSLRHNPQRPVGVVAEATVRFILRGQVRRMALQTSG